MEIIIGLLTLAAIFFILFVAFPFLSWLTSCIFFNPEHKICFHPQKDRIDLGVNTDSLGLFWYKNEQCDCCGHIFSKKTAGPKRRPS